MRNKTTIWNITGFSLALIALGSIFSGEALAQSAKCDSLRDQLQNASAASAPSRDYQRYDRAVKDQERQLRKAQRISRKNGCGGLFGASARCRRIRTAEQRMRKNLASLKKQRSRHASKRGPSAATIRARMQRSGCFNSDAKPKKANLQNRPDRRNQPDLVIQERGSPTPTTGGGAYRTLCVRTCDGYYFPISFAANRKRFQLDQQICQQMCPAAHVELYYHRSSSASETAISYGTNQPYTALPTAFSYRKKLNADCTCSKGVKNGGFLPIAGNQSKKMTEIAGKTRSGMISVTKSEREIIYGVGIPSGRVEPAIDPESRANEAGHLTLAQIRSLFAPAALKKPSANTKFMAGKPGSQNADNGQSIVASDEPDQKKIRIVGPEFFPDQEAVK